MPFTTLLNESTANRFSFAKFQPFRHQSCTTVRTLHVRSGVRGGGGGGGGGCGVLVVVVRRDEGGTQT